MDTSRYSNAYYPLAFDQLLAQLGRPTISQLASSIFAKPLVTSNEIRTHITHNPILGLFLYRFHFVFFTKLGFTTEDFKNLIHPVIRPTLEHAFTYTHPIDTPLRKIDVTLWQPSDNHHLLNINEDRLYPDTRAVDNVVLAMLGKSGLDLKGSRRQLRTIMGAVQIRRFRELWRHCQQVCNRHPNDLYQHYTDERRNEIYVALPIQQLGLLRIAAREAFTLLFDRLLQDSPQSSSGFLISITRPLNLESMRFAKGSAPCSHVV